MRKRLTWFFLGLLTAGVVAYAAPRLTAPQPLSSQQIHVLAEHGFEPMVEVKEIIIELPGEPVPYPVKEIIRVNVAPAWVEPEIRYRDAECPDTIPELVEISGGCEVTVVETMARAFWDCSIDTDRGWSASRGPVLASEVHFEVSKAQQEPRFRRHLWLGPWKGPKGWGGQAALSGEGRKWAIMAGVGLAPYESVGISTISFDDDEGSDLLVSSDTNYEPSYFGMVGYRW